MIELKQLSEGELGEFILSFAKKYCKEGIPSYISYMYPGSDTKMVKVTRVNGTTIIEGVTKRTS